MVQPSCRQRVNHQVRTINDNYSFLSKKPSNNKIYKDALITSNESTYPQHGFVPQPTFDQFTRVHVVHYIHLESGFNLQQYV